MNISKTDGSLSIQADEFLWNCEEATPIHSLVRPFFEQWLKENRHWSLLDLGCGNGAFTHQLSKLVTNIKGLDLSKTGVEIASRAFPDIEFGVFDIGSPLPVEYQHKFNAVSSTEVIEHLLLPRELFARAREALLPGGELVVSTPYHGYLKNLAIALFNGFDNHWHPCRDYGHVKFFSIQTLTKLFHEEGFRVTKIERVGRIKPFACSMIVQGVRV